MQEYSSSSRDYLLRDELFGDNCSENHNGRGTSVLRRMEELVDLLHMFSFILRAVQGGEGRSGFLGMRSCDDYI